MENDYLLDKFRTKGDMAGVLEFDGETGYFYLVAVSHRGNQKIIDHLQVFSRNSYAERSELQIEWNDSQEKVGLFIGGELWALFDTVSRKKSGGNFTRESDPAVPLDEFYS